ncbi:MAG: hypothetical protein JXN64_00330 [Spirochaetes bacterium]|nr:hypothetical protein [Spirochaetota bacterium]
MFWNRSIKQIQARARAKEREIVEGYYLIELKSQRSKFIKELEDQRRELEKKSRDDIRAIEKKLGAEIIAFKIQVFELNKQIDQDKKAWAMYKDFIPKALKAVFAIRSKRELKFNEASLEWKEAQGAESQLEYLQEVIENITPKVNKLLNNKSMN